MPRTFTINQTITLEQVSGLLCSAFEGGSNYWYRIEQKIEPTTWEFDGEPKRGEDIHWIHDYPLNPRGALLISDQEGEENKSYRLDLETIQKGLETMATNYPHHFTNILMENADAETGDVFLQCCLFGEIIYG